MDLPPYLSHVDRKHGGHILSIWGCASFQPIDAPPKRGILLMTMNQTLDFPKNMFMDHAYRPHPLNDIVQLMSQSEHKGPHFRSMVKDGDMDNDVLQRRWCDIIILIMLLELGFSYHLKGMYRWMTRKPPSRSCGSCCWSFSLWCAHHLIFFPP